MGLEGEGGSNMSKGKNSAFIYFYYNTELNVKFDWNAYVIDVSWDIFASIPALNPLFTSPFYLLPLTTLLFPTLSDTLMVDTSVFNTFTVYHSLHKVVVLLSSHIFYSKLP